MVSHLLKKGSSLLEGELGPYLFVGCYTIMLAEALSSEMLFLGNILQYKTSRDKYGSAESYFRNVKDQVRCQHPEMQYGSDDF